MINRANDPRPSNVRVRPRVIDALGRLRPQHIWLIYAALASFVVLGNLGVQSGWRLTHWWISYDLGFVKRGLMGTLLKPLGAQLGHVLAANLASLAILAIATAAIVSAATVFTLRQREGSTAWLVSAAFITMPGSIAALAFDFGRYDGILVLILIWSTWATWQIMERPRILLGAALLAAQIIGVLVHEIHLFIAAPVIAAVILIRWRRGIQLARALVIVALGGTVLATGVVGVFGRITAHDPDALIVMAATELPFEPNENAILVLTRSLSDNLALAMDRWFSSIGIAALGSTAFGLVPLVIVLLVLLRPMGWLHRIIISVAALCPFALAILAVDIGRWATFASLNAVLVTMVVMDAEHEAGNLPAVPAPLIAVLGYAVLLGATLGGMAITVGIPWVATVINGGLSRLATF